MSDDVRTFPRWFVGTWPGGFESKLSLWGDGDAIDERWGEFVGCYDAYGPSEDVCRSIVADATGGFWKGVESVREVEG